MTGPDSALSQVVPFPRQGDVFFDPRPDRALRLSWHAEEGCAVLSLWRDGSCAGTFRLPIAEVPDFIDAMVRGLAAVATASTGKRAG
jgi:hypothetical protein